MPIKHTIEQGETTVSLSEKYGLFAQTIWDHADNAELKKKRKDMNVLLPGDVLVIPDKRLKEVDKPDKQKHKFKRKGVPVVFRLQMFDAGKARANQKYQLDVDGAVVRGCTDGKGILEEFVPPAAVSVQLIMEAAGAEFLLEFGQMDPADSISGVQKRLANLGIYGGSFSGELDEATRAAIRDFQARYKLTVNGEADAATQKNLFHTVRQGRGSASQPWYIEPKVYPGHEIPDKAERKTAVRTSLNSEKNKAVDTVAEIAPPGYYVIVGFGAAAVVNHTTLRRSKAGWDRINNVTVVHVGFEDPWKHYRSHLMGQIANLLSIPGYENSPVANGETLTVPRVSTAMASDTEHELIRLSDHYPFGMVNAWVAMIQTQAKEKPEGDVLKAIKAKLGSGWIQCEQFLDLDYPSNFPKYRLLLVDSFGKPGLLYGAKIDVCTGNGRPRISLPPKRADRTSTYGARPWQPPERWAKLGLSNRSVLSGLEAFCNETSWTNDSYICIMGSGGVGVNMVEIAEQTSGVKADWIASGTTHIDSFFNPRNDPLLKAWFVPASPEDPFPQAQEIKNLCVGKSPLAIGGLPADMRTNTNSLLIPAEAQFRYMQNAQLKGPENPPQGTTPVPDLSFEPGKGKPTVGIDAEGQMVRLDASGHFPFFGQTTAPTYARLILSSGQDFEAIGQAAAITSKLAKKGVLKDPSGGLVGLELVGGDVRVLGSQGDMAGLNTDDIDWSKRIVSYQRKKTKTVAVLRFGDEVAALLRRLPKSGPLFPYLIRVRTTDRATEF